MMSLLALPIPTPSAAHVDVIVHFFNRPLPNLNSSFPCPSILKFELIPTTNVSAAFPAHWMRLEEITKSQLSFILNSWPLISLEPSVLNGSHSPFSREISLPFSKVIIANILLCLEALPLSLSSSLSADNLMSYFTQKIEAITGNTFNIRSQYSLLCVHTQPCYVPSSCLRLLPLPASTWPLASSAT